MFPPKKWQLERARDHYDLYEANANSEARSRWAHALSAIIDGRSTTAEIVPLWRVKSRPIGEAEMANRPPRKVRS